MVSNPFDPFLRRALQGDALIPHDEAVSSKHLEIRPAFVEGRYHWHVKDLQSYPTARSLELR